MTEVNVIDAKRPFRWAPALAAGLLAAALAAPAAAQPAPLGGLDDYVRSAMEDWGVVGVGLAVVRDGEVLYATGYGERDLRTGEPVDENTLFAIGSNSKAFTAAALGMLADEGELTFEDRVTEHLPWFEVSDPWVTRELTVRDLVTHRSGLLRGDAVWYGVPVDREEVVRRMRHQPMTTSLRSAFGYNNLMFIAAGEVVEERSGMSWDDFVERRILDPLGMERSTTSTDPLPGMDNVAQPHTEHDDEVVAIPYRDIDNAGPAGSIVSSPAEMTRWMRTWLAGGEWNGQRILPEAYVKDALTPHTIAGDGRDDDMPMVNFDFYGLGFWLRDYRGEKLVMHGGGIDGMLSQFAFLPEHDAGVVVLTNTDGHNLQNALTFRVLDHLLGAPERDWSGVLLASYREAVARGDSARAAFVAERKSGTRPSLPLDAYAGTYENPMYGEVEVTMEGGRLRLTRGPEFRGVLEHWHLDTFEVDWGEARNDADTFVTFDLGFDGTVSGFDARGFPAGGPMPTEFTRVPEPTTAEEAGR